MCSLNVSVFWVLSPKSSLNTLVKNDNEEDLPILNITRSENL